MADQDAVFAEEPFVDPGPPNVQPPAEPFAFGPRNAAPTGGFQGSRQIRERKGRTQGGPATRQAAQALGLLDGPDPILTPGRAFKFGPSRTKAYQYVYRAHHGASKGLSAKQIRHLYRYRVKRKVSPETRARIRAMGAINGPALKAAKAAAKAAGRRMTKQDFYAAGGMRPKNAAR